SVAGLFFGQDAVRTSLSAQFQSLLGPVGSQAVDAMLKGAGSVTGAGITAAVGVVLLLVAATGVVVQFKDALNTFGKSKRLRAWGGGPMSGPISCRSRASSGSDFYWLCRLS